MQHCIERVQSFSQSFLNDVSRKVYVISGSALLLTKYRFLLITLIKNKCNKQTLF